MQYCRFQSEHGPQFAEVVHREGEDWIERLIPPPGEELSTPVPAPPPPYEFIPRLLSTVRLLVPVNPSKIVCIGRNYRDHAAELGNEVPAAPLLFLKPPSALLASGESIRIPSASKRVDFEGELGLVIGKTCRNLGPDEDWRPYVRGYVCVNDVTARDLQKTDGQWSRAKGFDTFCPVGPFVTDEIDPEAGVEVSTHINGERKQHGSTLQLIFPIPVLLRYISAAMTLNPGDLIPTGTPAGVGPMQPGDQVSVSITGCGTLANPVEA